MRISTRQIQQLGIDSILAQQEKLSRTQQQVATGKRVLLPSDDPVATTQLLQLRQSIETTEQYQANADAAINRLQQEEGVLTSITEILQSVRVLAVQGNNASQTNETRGFMAEEIRQRIEELIGLANTRDGTGDYLFAGTMGATTPFIKDSQGKYVYQGDQNQRYLQVGNGRRVADGDAGSAVFQLVRNGNGTFVAAPSGNATVQADVANSGTALVEGVVVSAQSILALDGYSIVFDAVTPGSYEVVDAAGSSLTPPVTGTYVSPGPEDIDISIGGDVVATVTMSGTPEPNDRFTLDLSGMPRGTAVIGEATLVDGTFIPSLPNGYTLTFSRPIPDGSISYQVTDSTGAQVKSGPWVENQPIEFNGARLAITGTPADGDTFTVRSSEYQNIFQTLENLATALDAPVHGPADQAHLNNAVNRALGDIDLAMENILLVRAGVGSRLNAIESQVYVNESYLIQAQETLSSVEDLDYAEAISRLHMQMAGLEAAQQTYLKVNGLSIFNYLR